MAGPQCVAHLGAVVLPAVQGLAAAPRTVPGWRSAADCLGGPGADLADKSSRLWNGDGGSGGVCVSDERGSE